MVFADTIFTDATVHTMTSRSSRASAVAIRNGRIIATGDNHHVLDYRGPLTKTVNGRGMTITPGLIDAHLHPIQGADITVGLDLRDVTTLAQLFAALTHEAERIQREEPGGWIRAWNLDYAAFEGAPLHAATIEEATRGIPTLILFFDVHTAVANRPALERAGIHGTQTFRDTSEIMVDAAGTPTGELREESAFNLVLDATPRLNHAQTKERSRATLLSLRRQGITGGVLMDGNQTSLDLLADLDSDEHGLPLRLQSALIHNPGFSEEQTLDIIANRDAHGERWRGGLIKLFSDGVIDSGTAWMYEPDTHGESLGSFWHTADEFTATVRRYTRAGFQIATHAIGDRAIGETVRAYIAAGAHSHSGAAHRVEHMECTSDADLALMAQHGITASIQPAHMQWRAADGSDAWAERLGPDRARKAWRTGDALRAGALLALGSDWPVADLDARLGMAWARLRRTPGDTSGFVFEPEQRLSAWEALAGYTLWAARAQGDNDLGVIAPGYRADLTVWADDPLAVSGDDLLHIPVLDSYVDGESLTHHQHA